MVVRQGHRTEALMRAQEVQFVLRDSGLLDKNGEEWE